MVFGHGSAGNWPGQKPQNPPLPGGGAAIYNSSGLNFIRHTDWLGSSRLATTWAAHAVYSKEAYAPFGETYNEAGTADRSFAGQDQDVVTGSLGTGVYDFLFRKHDPSAGRWLSPDPYGWNAVDQTNPQTLNRYAYVTNMPVALFDPMGLEEQCQGYSTGSGGGYDQPCQDVLNMSNYVLQLNGWAVGDGNIRCEQDSACLSPYSFFTEPLPMLSLAPGGNTGTGGSGPTGSESPTVQNVNKRLIKRAYEKYEACTGGINWGNVASQSGVGSFPSGSAPSSGGEPSPTDMGPRGPEAGPSFGSPILDLALSTAKRCLQKFPLAALDPRFIDIKPSDAR